MRSERELEREAVVVASVSELLEPPSENTLLLGLDSPVGLPESLGGVGPCHFLLLLWVIRHVYSSSKTALLFDFFLRASPSRRLRSERLPIIGTPRGPP